MLKFRRLNKEELEALEDEFIKFLSAQSISAPDWQKIKNKNINKQNELIDMFSNIVLERVLSNIDFLEITTQDEIKVFKMKSDSGHLLGLKIEDDGINLMDDSQLNALFTGKTRIQNHKLKVYKLEKAYTKTKAEEAFFLINLGAKITNKTLFSFIQSLIKDKA